MTDMDEENVIANVAVALETCTEVTIKFKTKLIHLHNSHIKAI